MGTKHWHTYLCVLSIIVQPLFGMYRVAAVAARSKPHQPSVRVRPAFDVSAIKTYADVDALTKMTDRHFAEVPGYATLKKRLYASLDTKKEPHIQGYAYELLVACYLVHAEKQTVCAFEQKYTHPELCFTREIDIITDRCAIECKNISWEAVQRSAFITASIAKQFSEQAALVHAGLVGVPYFMVCSKNPIPFAWKTWFWQQAILYMEGPY